MAPPKKDTEAAYDENIRALCVLMASSAEFSPDYNVVAIALGIAQSKNVPRKIDSIIKPYGYVIKSKKVVKLNEDGTAPDVPATPKAKVPKTPATSEAEDEKLATPKSSKTPAKKNSATGTNKAPIKKAVTPRPKKRKIEETKAAEAEDEENESGDDDEAMKMIKEKMGNGTDEDGEEVKGKE